MDDAGRVNPYEHLAFPGTGLLRLVVGERLGAIAGAQTNGLHAPLPNKHLSAELELDGGLSSISVSIEEVCRKTLQVGKLAQAWRSRAFVRSLSGPRKSISSPEVMPVR